MHLNYQPNKWRPKINFVIALATAISISTLSPVFAGSHATCGNADRSTWMSEEAVMKRATELGYEPAKVKVEDGCYEVYAKKDGKKFEVFINTVSGELVRVKNDD